MDNHHLDFNARCHSEHPFALPPLPSQVFERINVLLASNSPRRRELLGLIMPSFEVALPRDVEEVYPPTIAATEVPAYLAQLKADACADVLTDNELIITADTVVISDDKILGKPSGAEHAAQMLKDLQGRTHTVVTGVTLRSLSGKKNDTFSEHTDVTFGPLSDQEIERYVEIYRPFDKAGAYGIQEWIGAAAICKVNGCFYNVMGLPLHALYTHLKAFFA